MLLWPERTPRPRQYRTELPQEGGRERHSVPLGGPGSEESRHGRRVGVVHEPRRRTRGVDRSGRSQAEEAEPSPRDAEVAVAEGHLLLPGPIEEDAVLVRGALDDAQSEVVGR